MFKERYFPNVHVLKASKGQVSSFLWSGIWTAKEELTRGFRWVLGNGESIVATRDPWLRNKEHFMVSKSQFYEGREKKVSDLMMLGMKQWDESLIIHQFLQDDAEAILALHIPQNAKPDRLVWANASNEIYTAK